MVKGEVVPAQATLGNLAVCHRLPLKIRKDRRYRCRIIAEASPRVNMHQRPAAW